MGCLSSENVFMIILNRKSLIFIILFLFFFFLFQFGGSLLPFFEFEKGKKKKKKIRKCINVFMKHFTTR